METALNFFNHWVQRTALVSTNRLLLLGWQPITAKITAIFAASSVYGLLIGPFLVAQPCSTLFVETKSVRSSVSNAASILSILLESDWCEDSGDVPVSLWMARLSWRHYREVCRSYCQSLYKRSDMISWHVEIW